MVKSPIQAVFIDRDGTLGGSDIVTLPSEFESYPFTQKALNLLKEADKSVFSFTNQPGIARGESTVEEFEKELLSFGFDKVYICPHEHGEGCKCRKPAIGMLLQATQDYSLDLHRCVVIGDRWTDMVAANNSLCLKVLVKTGAGKKELAKYDKGNFYGEWIEAYPDYIADDIYDAVRWILGSEK